MKDWAPTNKSVHSFWAHIQQSIKKEIIMGKEFWTCAVNNFFLRAHLLTTYAKMLQGV